MRKSPSRVHSFGASECTLEPKFAPQACNLSNYKNQRPLSTSPSHHAMNDGIFSFPCHLRNPTTPNLRALITHKVSVDVAASLSLDGDNRARRRPPSRLLDIVMARLRQSKQSIVDVSIVATSTQPAGVPFQCMGALERQWVMAVCYQKQK